MIGLNYATEIAPSSLRHVLTSYMNFCIILGHLVGSGVLRALADHKGAWAYRIPFALQWVWLMPALIGICFAPESPLYVFLINNIRLGSILT